ncbi:hypothetical protein [Deinococcus arenicola]|uniref:DUF4145 domain-containing protein n=1 Tax=Deinococcus arenicola TaxID=2994950 RepID=A0ABU4DX20_9DEIO|nr:hypothetical protein [Deinococcus sp. ZS9-10]MDV6376430.1 hypothetical protein [Deinococcus sp. ZS9-10]
MDAPPPLNRQEIEKELSTIMKQTERHLDVIDFVVVRQTLRKIIDEAMLESEEFEKAIAEGGDDFVKDVNNSDPLPFIVRGTLHIENKIIEILEYFNKYSKSLDTLDKKIKALNTSTPYPPDDIPVLHAIRRIRNIPAHELAGGRSVDRKVADDLYMTLSEKRREEIQQRLEPKPLLLDPAMLMKLVLSSAYHDLESYLRERRWQDLLKRALRVAN